MTIPPAVADHALAAVAELLTAFRHHGVTGLRATIPALLADRDAIGDAEAQRLHDAIVLAALTPLAALAADHLCRTKYGGDWPRTVAAIRATVIR